jgi:glycosyltransferase involved in cell wall biosynthesis
MTLGYLVPEFPGQTHIFFLREIERLAQRGAQVHLISTRRPRVATCKHERLNSLAERTDYLFPPHVGHALRTFARRPLGLVRALGLWLATCQGPRAALRNLVALACGAELLWLSERHGFSHVHVHSCGSSALIAAFCSRLGGPSYSLTLHNPLSTFGPHQPEKWRNASFGIVITRRILEEVRSTLGPSLPGRVAVAPMGVDLERFRRGYDEPYQPWTGEGPFRVFSCGRLNPCKAHDDLIRAAGLLRDRGCEVRLQIAGSVDHAGSGYGAALEALIEEFDLRDSVELLGPRSEEEIITRLKQSHAFCLLSLEEPLGVVLMEAMALAVPVVATSAGGVPELVVDGLSGLLVSPRRPDEAASALLRLRNDPALSWALGAEGRRTVVERFGSEVSAKAILDGVRATHASDMPDSN